MTNLFPSPYPTLLGDDPELQSCLDLAVSKALQEFPSISTPFRTAISIVAIDESNTPMDFKHAGLRYGESFYSASLLKIGAMYAAYELRRSVNNLAAELGANVYTASEMFASLQSEFDSQISHNFDDILWKLHITLSPEDRKKIKPPKYDQIFAAIPLTTGGFALDFGGQFQNNMNQMIINSNNNSAAACIEALGYEWIDGALSAGGFFFPEGKTGIWLAGTFTGSLPAVRIHSENDDDVAQATTCFDMANLYAHMFQQTLVDSGSSTEMLNMLFVTAAVGDDPSYLDYNRRQLPPRNFAVTHSKIGSGPLKTGAIVISDAAIVEFIVSSGVGKRFIVVFQNSFADNDSVYAMGSIVDRTIELFHFGP